jgi:hypothetical protein
MNVITQNEPRQQAIGFVPHGMTEDEVSQADLESLFHEIGKEFFAGEFVSQQDPVADYDECPW